MKKLILFALLITGISVSSESFAQTQKADKKEVRSDVKYSESEKKDYKGKNSKADKKEERSDIKDNKSDKKDIKGK